MAAAPLRTPLRAAEGRRGRRGAHGTARTATQRSRDMQGKSPCKCCEAAMRRAAAARRIARRIARRQSREDRQAEAGGRCPRAQGGGPRREAAVVTHKTARSARASSRTPEPSSTCFAAPSAPTGRTSPKLRGRNLLRRRLSVVAQRSRRIVGAALGSAEHCNGAQECGAWGPRADAR
eukprot:gene1535-3664_t